MKKDGCGSRSVQMAYEAVRAALNVAVKAGKIMSNPVHRVTTPKHTKKSYHAPDHEKARALLAAARPGREQTLFALGVELGLRIGEALALRWVDVDLAEATLTISATLSNQGERVEPKTASSVRRLALPALTLGLLRDLRAGHHGEETDFVFCTDTGRPLNRHNVRRDLRRACDRAGIEPVRFHALRATSLSLRLAGGAAYEDVARVAGHASTRMLLEVYGRPMQGDRRMADLMDAVWKNGPEMAPKWLSGPVHAKRPKAKNPRRSADSDVVEVRRLELLTPYMRSKCSTN